MDMEKLFEDILREDKDHLIRKLDMEDEEKDLVSEFFRTHPNLEKSIDWNRLDLSYDDFERIMKDNQGSRSNMKKRTRSDLSLMFEEFVGKGEAEVWCRWNDFIFVSPLSHRCAVFMDSYDCYGIGAKWCIGTEESDHHWNQYVFEEENSFVFFYGSDPKRKFMIQIKDNGMCLIWDVTDKIVFRSSRVVPEILEVLGLDIYDGQLMDEFRWMMKEVQERFVGLREVYFRSKRKEIEDFKRLFRLVKMRLMEVSDPSSRFTPDFLRILLRICSIHDEGEMSYMEARLLMDFFEIDYDEDILNMMFDDEELISILDGLQSIETEIEEKYDRMR